MPAVIEEIQHSYILEPFEAELPQHFKNFCGDLAVMKQKIVKDLKEASKLAVKQALGIERWSIYVGNFLRVKYMLLYINM